MFDHERRGTLLSFHHLPLQVSGLVVLAVAFASSCSSGGSNEPEEASTAEASVDNGARAATSIGSFAFYYQNIDAETDLSKLGTVDLVVTGPQRNEADAIAAIHAVGARALRYVQFYWAPEDRLYEGIDFSVHPEWAFCREGNTPVVGRISDGSTRWYYLDANERDVQAAAAAALERIRAAGWDGVMFDRGWAATQTGTDIDSLPVWSAVSSCTQEPVRERARFADAYVRVVSLAKPLGLDVLFNNGISPYDPLVPMRPDASDPDCQQQDWGACGTLEDVWPHVDYVLNEAIAHPQDAEFQRDFEANEATEREGRVLGLLTEGTMGGQHSRDTAYFEWARVKLFDIPLSVNTGDDGCPGADPGTPCNRRAIYPELNSARLGTPTDPQPVADQCEAESATQCLWIRPYELGVVIANVSPKSRTLEHDVGDGCRYLFDVYASQALDGNRCVEEVSLDLPAWTGRVVRFGAERW